MAIPKKKPSKTPLAQWLKDNNRTQLWLVQQLEAKGTDVSMAQMSRLVRGFNMPRAQLALRIQEITGVTVEQLAKARAKSDDKATLIARGQALIARGEAIIQAASK